MLGSLVSPGEVHERAHEQEHRQHGDNGIRQGTHLAIAVDQGSPDVAEPVLSAVAAKGDGEFIVVPAETGIVEVDDMQAPLAADQVVGMQISMYQAEGLGLVPQVR